jgi:capsular polysaccharide transport system permease protein
MSLNLALPESRSGRYLLCVVAPAVLAWVYLILLAADGYVSRAQVMVEQESSSAVAGAELALGLLNVGGGKSKQDALLVENFMRSRTMLEYLDAELDLRGHFSEPLVDVIGRLDAQASAEDFLDYYRDRLIVTIDDESLIVEIEFTSFDPEYSREVVRKLIGRSEGFVNEISRQFAREQLSFVEEQVAQANERLKAATREMIALQRSNEIFSPSLEVESVGRILAELEAALAEGQTQLKALSSYMNPSAPEVVAARQRVQALKEQIAQERARMVGHKDAGLNDLMLAYQDAETNVRLTTEIYKTALASLEATRLDSVRKVKFLASVDAPSLPDSVEHPRVLYWTLTIFIFLNIAYFVMNLIIATVEDHRE